MRAALLVLALLAGAAAAALRAAPSSAAELKVATWNLEWLTLRPAGDPALPANVAPKSAEDLARLRRYALQLDADVIAIQEVDGAEAAAEVFPTDRYALVLTGDQVVQRVGFAIRRGLAFERNPDLAGLDVTPEAEHRLRSGADITVMPPAGDQGPPRLRLLSIHLKSGCQRLPIRPRSIQIGNGACDLLARQVAPLQGWIAQRRAEGVPYVILGDFNRVMDERDALLSELVRSATGGPLARATEGKASPCWGGSAFIDHILAGGAAVAWMRSETLRVLVYREQGLEWKERLSDHCPVSVRFLLPGIPLR